MFLWTLFCAVCVQSCWWMLGYGTMAGLMMRKLNASACQDNYASNFLGAVQGNTCSVQHDCSSEHKATSIKTVVGDSGAKELKPGTKNKPTVLELTITPLKSPRNSSHFHRPKSSENPSLKSFLKAVSTTKFYLVY